MEKNFKNYYLGLDIGTNSCGFAVTDYDYNVLRVKGKRFWGVRLFDGAETSEARRQKRANRRRLDRRKLKLSWLNEIFAEEIEKVDKNFFDRIKYSPLFLEDKQLNNNSLGKYSLFDGEIDGVKYTDREFYKDYSSIYHLRKELLTVPAKDIRLLYLAIHSIIKRRGHFLYEGEFSENSNVLGTINDLVKFANTFSETNIFSLQEITSEKEKGLLELLSKGFKKKESKLFLYEALNAKAKHEKALIDSVVNGIFDCEKIFQKELEKLDFSSDDIQDKILNLDSVEEEELILIEKAKSLFSLFQLKKVLGNYNYIAE